jgi:hypothetical protein
MHEFLAMLTTGAERAGGAAFGTVAALRRGRAVHTRGCGYAARIRVEPRFRTRWPVPDAPATVRLSRGAGLPDAVPDILGIGVRVHVAEAGGSGPDIDLLAASSNERVGLRHVLQPARYFDRPFFSSLMAFKVDDQRTLYGFRVSGSSDLTLGDACAHRKIPRRLELVVAGLTGRWEPMATVEFVSWVDDAESEPLALDPRHGGPFRADGPVTRVRVAAYAASQAARGAGRQRPLPEHRAGLADRIVKPGDHRPGGRMS